VGEILTIRDADHILLIEKATKHLCTQLLPGANPIKLFTHKNDVEMATKIVISPVKVFLRQKLQATGIILGSGT
jgi:hypothetical protein